MRQISKYISLVLGLLLGGGVIGLVAWAAFFRRRKEPDEDSE